MSRTLLQTFTILVLLLILVVENNANSIAEAPTPQPQPSSTSPLRGTTEGSLHPQECGGRCTGRCSKTAFKKPCMFFCQKCCSKCLCVPQGTYGNKQSCPLSTIDKIKLMHNEPAEKLWDPGEDAGA